MEFPLKACEAVESGVGRFSRNPPLEDVALELPTAAATATAATTAAKGFAVLFAGPGAELFDLANRLFGLALLFSSFHLIPPTEWAALLSGTSRSD